MSPEQVKAKLDACISEIVHDAGNGLVTDWQLAVVSMKTENLDERVHSYSLYGSDMPYHAAYGLAQWTVDAVMDDVED
jgi:hypothetical protein